MTARWKREGAQRTRRFMTYASAENVLDEMSERGLGERVSETIIGQGPVFEQLIYFQGMSEVDGYAEIQLTILPRSLFVVNFEAGFNSVRVQNSVLYSGDDFYEAVRIYRKTFAMVTKNKKALESFLEGKYLSIINLP